MKCPKCQFDNREGVKFCEECRAKLELVCPKCGADISLSRKFCGECGYDLRGAKALPTIDYSRPQSYTPKFLAEKIRTSRSSIEGERKLLTVLFADVANYTSMSEKLDPEEIHQIMNGCFKILMDEIHRYEGTIDKFTGDGVMALFGAPVAHEHHAQRACYGALAIQRALGKYGRKVKREFGMDFKMRVGLNSGPVLVDSVGDDLHMEYTAIGDTVNLASRMESMATPGKVLVSADTYKMAENFFRFKPLGKVSVKGKEELVEVYELVEAGEVETRFEAAIVKGLTKFVGREREITNLEEAFERAKLGSGQFVGVVGEAGIGKSRILLELRVVLPQEEYTYLEGRCLHYGGSMAYLPFLDVLRSYFGVEEGERESAIKKKMKEKVNQLDEKLKGILPPLHEILSLKVDDEEHLNLQPKQRRERIFEAIRDLFIQESQNRPLVLAVEDVHWIDKTSEEFLSYLMSWLGNAHVLLVILYRPEYTPPWGSKSCYTQLNVAQLSARASAELVQSILEGGEVVPELRELIIARAGGNPLFVEELTHTLLENGSIEKKDHQYVLSTKASEIQVPDTIQEIIAARMDRLEDHLKRTMQVASVVGREFAFRVLHTITGMREELKWYLLELQGLEFIYEKSLFPELEYIFKHALTQEVAYKSLLIKRRKQIHEKIGKAIEELYRDRLEEFYEMLAHHYSRSENWEKAYQYLKLAGEKATRSYSNWEAFRFYKEAIKALSQLPDIEENKRRQVEVRILMESPMMLVGYPEDSLQIIEEGERLSRELGDARNLAMSYSHLALYYSLKGDSLRGTRYVASAFQEAEKIQDIELMVPLGGDLFVSYLLAAQCWKVTEAAPRVIALLEKTRRESEYFGKGMNPYSVICANYGHALAWMGNFTEGDAWCEKALHFALELNDLSTIANAEMMYGFVFFHRGDGRNAVQHFQNAVKYAEEAQYVVMLGMCWAALGWMYYLLGELENARKHAEKAIKFHNETGLPYMLAVPYRVLGVVHLDLGALKDAQSCMERSLELAKNTNERSEEGVTKLYLGRVLGKARKPQYGKAEKCILEGIRILDELKLKPWTSQGYLNLGELYADRGQSEKALETLKKAENAFQEMGMDCWLRRTREVLQRVQG
jgi:class 3 adenylate cyclase/tetratricopeptide (TPR) repeat protein